MSRDGKGYLIPDPPIPEGLRCIKLWIPDDDLYLYALAGSIQYLTTWKAWALDEGKNGRYAALAWWAAWEYTQTNGWLNCGDEIPPGDDEVTTIINNIHCGSGCGCGDGSDAPVYLPPGGGNPITIPFPTTGDENPIPPPPASPTEPPEPYFPGDPVWPDRAAWEEARCRIANYGWRIISNFLFNMEQLDNRVVSIGVILGIFIAYAPAYILARIGASQLVYLIAAIGEFTAVTGAWSAFWSVIHGWWEDHQAEIVCWAYEAVDSEALSETMIVEATEELTEAWDAIPGWTQTMIDAAVRAFALMFNPGVASLLYNFTAPDYTTIEVDCETCGITQDFRYRLYDKDGVEYATATPMFGEPFTVLPEDCTPGSGGGFLLLFRFENMLGELKNVEGALLDAPGHAPPTNSNHPFTIQYSINDGAQDVTLIALNNAIPEPTVIDGYHKFYLHSLTEFGVELLINSID